MSKKRVKAYSYLRFSTPEQQRGDSFRRQSEAARRFAREHGLELDEALTFEDLGVSAFRGKNVESGRLGDFLEAVKTGEVPRGSYLLVESLDRISRGTARKAVRVLEDICEAGIKVATLMDGKVYDEDALDDPIGLIMSVLYFARANEESTTKSRRLREAWSEKRRKLGSGTALTSRCPAWLRLNRPTGEFKIIEDRAKVVRQIFRWAAEGVGQQSIAKRLNEQRVRPFGRAEYWQRSYIMKLLDSAAVLGHFTPHTVEHKAGKKTRRPQATIENYFPPIITPEVYAKVRALRMDAGAPQRGRHANAPLGNVFAGLARCPLCDSTLTLANKGSGWRYLVCTKAKAKGKCPGVSVRYEVAEAGLRHVADSLLKEAPSDNDRARALAAEAEKISGEVLEWEEAIGNLVGEAEKAGTTPTGAIAQRIAELEQQLDERRQQRDALSSEAESLSGRTIKHRVAEAGKRFRERTFDRAAVNLALRALVSGVVIDPDAGTIGFQWKHADETAEALYRWPKEGTEKRKGRPPVAAR